MYALASCFFLPYSRATDGRKYLEALFLSLAGTRHRFAVSWGSETELALPAVLKLRYMNTRHIAYMAIEEKRTTRALIEWFLYEFCF